MDMTDTIVPRSDQLNAEDMLTAPVTVTVTDVRRGSTEQPVEIVTAEFGDGRPFKPSKTVRRILAAAWGAEASEYVGRRMTLYRDPTVKFGGMDVGGIRISHMSHIDKQFTINLTATRGKRAPHTVKPLADPPAPKPTSRIPELVAALNTLGVTDKADCLAVVSQIADRKLTSANDLTPDELATALDTLAAFNGDGERVRAAFELPAGGS